MKKILVLISLSFVCVSVAGDPVYLEPGQPAFEEMALLQAQDGKIYEVVGDEQIYAVVGEEPIYATLDESFGSSGIGSSCDELDHPTSSNTVRPTFWQKLLHKKRITPQSKTATVSVPQIKTVTVSVPRVTSFIQALKTIDATYPQVMSDASMLQNAVNKNSPVYNKTRKTFCQQYKPIIKLAKDARQGSIYEAAQGPVAVAQLIDMLPKKPQQEKLQQEKLQQEKLQQEKLQRARILQEIGNLPARILIQTVGLTTLDGVKDVEVPFKTLSGDQMNTIFMKIRDSLAICVPEINPDSTSERIKIRNTLDAMLSDRMATTMSALMRALDSGNPLCQEAIRNIFQGGSAHLDAQTQEFVDLYIKLSQPTATSRPIIRKLIDTYDSINSDVCLLQLEERLKEIAALDAQDRSVAKGMVTYDLAFLDEQKAKNMLSSAQQKKLGYLKEKIETVCS